MAAARSSPASAKAREAADCSRRVIVSGFVIACLVSLATFGLVLVATWQAREVALQDTALVEKGTLRAVSTRRRQAPVEDPLYAQWLTVKDGAGGQTRLRVQAVQRHEAAGGARFLFSTAQGLFALTPAGPRLAVRQVEQQPPPRHLLNAGMQVNLFGVATGEGGLPDNVRVEGKVKAVVDHVYGVNGITCPAGTTQVGRHGQQLPPLCAGHAEGYSAQAAAAGLCRGPVPGFYDTQFAGKCADFCFYQSPTQSCGDGFWTCAAGALRRPMRPTAPQLAPPGTHDAALFCDTHEQCAFPRCSEEGAVSTVDWFPAVVVRGGEVKVDVGRAAFNRAFESCGIVEYFFDGVPYAYYQRLAPITDYFDAYGLFTQMWTQVHNELGVDFRIYSSEDELRSAPHNSSGWRYCDYNTPFDTPSQVTGFPKDCGPEAPTPLKWFSMPSAARPFANSQNFGLRVYAGAALPCGLWDRVVSAPSPPPPSPPPPPAPPLQGSGEYSFLDRSVYGHPTRVLYYVPGDLPPDAPVVVLIHGFEPRPELAVGLRDMFVREANRRGWLLVAPVLEGGSFPGNRASLLGRCDVPVEGAGGQSRGCAWSLLEPLVSDFQRRAGSSAAQYSIFAHSAGAQWAHRLIMFQPRGRYDVVVLANSGWYTLPDPDINFPYGTKGSRLSDPGAPTNYLQQKVVVMLGEQDTDYWSPGLRHTPRTDAQGTTRLDRGLFYFRHMQAAAAAMNASLNWDLEVVPDTGHDVALMARAGAAFLARFAQTGPAAWAEEIAELPSTDRGRVRAALPHENCTQWWHLDGEHFKYCRPPRSFAAASATCQQYGSGVHLATLGSEAQAERLALKILEATGRNWTSAQEGSAPLAPWIGLVSSEGGCDPDSGDDASDWQWEGTGERSDAKGRRLYTGVGSGRPALGCPAGPGVRAAAVYRVGSGLTSVALNTTDLFPYVCSYSVNGTRASCHTAEEGTLCHHWSSDLEHSRQHGDLRTFEEAQDYVFRREFRTEEGDLVCPRPACHPDPDSEGEALDGFELVYAGFEPLHARRGTEGPGLKGCFTASAPSPAAAQQQCAELCDELGHCRGFVVEDSGVCCLRAGWRDEEVTLDAPGASTWRRTSWHARETITVEDLTATEGAVAVSSDFDASWRNTTDAGNAIDGCVEYNRSCAVMFQDWLYVDWGFLKTLTTGTVQQLGEHSDGQQYGNTNFKWQALASSSDEPDDPAAVWVDVSGEVQDAHCDRPGNRCSEASLRFPSGTVTRAVRVQRTGGAFPKDGWFRLEELTVRGFEPE